jgi:hypothetical protein
MHQRWFQSVSFLSFAAMALAFPNVAAADVFDMDEFALARNGPTIFDDSFNQNMTFSGGAGTFFNSGTDFTGTTIMGRYFVHGTIAETTANAGQAVLDTANGFVETQPDPFIPKIRIDEAFLQTGNIHAPTPRILNSATTFSVTGLFDLSEPTTVLGTYDVALTNDTPTAPGATLQMRVRELSAGPILQFGWVDKVTNTFISIGQTDITADLAYPQVELELSHTAGSDAITASYAFGTGNTLGGFMASVSGGLGTTGSNTDMFTIADFALAGFQGFTPVVPEPPTWAMMLLGFAGVGFVGYRRAKKTHAALAA